MERNDLLSLSDAGDRGPRPFDCNDCGELSRLDAAELDCEFTDRDRDLDEPLPSPPFDSPDVDDEFEADEPGLDSSLSISIVSKISKQLIISQLKYNFY